MKSDKVMKLIDKDAVVAEIEKRKSELQSRIAELGTFESNTLGLFQDMDLYNDILSFIGILEVREVDLEKIKRDWRNKGYIEGRKQALIPARKLGLPKSLNIIDMEEVKATAKAWSEDDENTCGCDYIGATVAERALFLDGQGEQKPAEWSE